jgi:hypothetical protein
METIKSVEDMMDALVDKVKTMGDIARAGEADASAADAERLIFSQLLAVGRRLMQQYVAALGTGDEGFRIQRGELEYQRKVCREVTLLTVFGEVKVPRWLYYAPGGAGRLAPTEATANLPARQASYFVQQLVGRLALEETYADSVGFFSDLFGIDMSTHTADEIIGDMAGHHADYVAPLPEPETEAAIQVVALDGKGVPVIKSADGQGKSPPRLAKGEKRQRKKEALVGVEYTVAPHVRSAEALAFGLVTPQLLSEEQKRDLLRPARGTQTHYEASIEDKASVAAALRQRVERKQQAVATARPVVVLIDGAERLETMAREHFAEAEVILDIIHVVEYLWQAAHAVHGEGSAEAAPLVCALLQTILEGRVGHAIGGLRQRRSRLKGSRQKTLDKVIGYLDNHRQMMAYDRYLAAGYPIGTGVVESACGHLVKNRMEKAGARWSLPGAEAVLRLRALRASGHWKAYLTHRETAEHHALYQAAS